MQPDTIGKGESCIRPAVFGSPVCGVHEKYLKYYLAICEHRINLKRISPAFIAGLVAVHKS